VPLLDPTRVSVLLRCRDRLLVEDGERLVFGRQRGTAGGFGVFVLSLVGSALIFGALVQLIRYLGSNEGLALATLFGAAGPLLLLQAFRDIRELRVAQERTPIQPFFVVDLAQGVAYGEDGTVVPLSAVTFRMDGRIWEKWQALECTWDGGSIELLRTLVFEGNAALALRILERRGLTVSYTSLWLW